jgi:ADP-heptose:LPS heptosyltransferase
VPDPLLVVAPSSWRDACFSLPATRALAAVCEVTVFCPDVQAPLWQAAGGVGVAVHDGSGPGIAAALPDRPRVLLWEDGPAAKACRKARIPHRTGLPAKSLAKRLTHPLERLIRPGPATHEVGRFLDVVSLLGAQPAEARWFEPVATPAEPDALLLAPDSDFGRHFEWPVERWIEALGSMDLDAARVNVAPGPLGEALAAGLDLEPATLKRPTDAGRFGLLIGADASLPHVAAALGTTCAVLFGPGDPRLTRPLGKRHTVIRQPVECSPCFAETCPLDGRCQNDLEVGRVTAALSRFLKP